jgi:UDP-3-O-[3-hydroxymyristoyl] glucosamine N-acyltransferase
MKHAAWIELPRPVRLSVLAQRHGGAVDDPAKDLEIRAVAPLDSAGEGHLAPLTSGRYVAMAEQTQAGLLVDAALADRCPSGRRWVHSHGSWALAGLLSDAFGDGLQQAYDGTTRLRDGAYVSENAIVAADATVGPFAVILAGAVIGSKSVVEPHAIVYPRVHVGERVHIGASSVIGRPGFGWANGPDGSVRRVPQLGGVVIDDDVEIGPLVTVDAGTLAPTVLSRGVRLDAHVHVGHNVVVGAGSIVAAQSGFAGSVKIGPGVLVGGQVGVADHVTIGERARLAAKAGVIGDVRAGTTVAGYPAVDRVRWLRGIARMLRSGAK